MKFIRLWGPVLVWMSIIFFFSTRQRIVVSEEATINFLFFKTLHVCEYSLLYALAYRASLVSLKKHPGLAAFLITVLYAASDEIHQLFVPTREGTLRDVIIDATAAAIIWILLTQVLPRAPRRLRQWARALELVS